MYIGGKLAVPEDLVSELVKEHHRAANHPGNERLCNDLHHRYEFSFGHGHPSPGCPSSSGMSYLPGMRATFVASEGAIACTVVPDRFMASVSMDVFSMPERAG